MALTTSRGRGFSLIELLVVIAIIAIVVAILIPALRGARISARKATTMATMRDLSAASSAFTLDNKRNPGYFNATAMGAAANNDPSAGFTGMQNVLLDLSGGITQAPLAVGTVIEVGPGGSSPARVDLTKIGASGAGKGYFTPSKNLLVADPGLAAGGGNLQMPQVVDAFGMPILAWVADERPTTVFARQTSNGGVARFYWASNAGVLNSTSLGRDQRRQSFSGTDACSMLGGGASAGDLEITLAGLLGNPAFPRVNSNPLAPDAARGQVVFHSAGPDGFFMGRLDRGTKAYGSPSGGIVQVPYRSGIDVMGDYDDSVQATGN